MKEPCHQRPCLCFALYFVFGALHELVHLFVGVFWLSCHDAVRSSWYQVFVGRQTHFSDDDCDDEPVLRHSGWIFSLFLALFLRKLTSNSSTITWVATVVAIEALWTDLLRLPTLTAMSLPITDGVSTYFCGNFGIILVQDAWLKNTSKALDVLQRMVQVTMVRGAQSGGVVAFSTEDERPVIATRSRVVNKKRTDLSNLLRRQLWWDTMGKAVRVYAGHTRFATSSKATLEGTHPQQWSPPSKWTCFNTRTNKFESNRVGNFVTHNGDFDFFNVHGTTYDLQAVQGWLECVTKVPLPAQVDSCAVAGLIDILRSGRSFGLSCRFALALGMRNCQIKLYPKFPEKDFFESIGKAFEEAMTGLLNTSTFEQINCDPSLRSTLATKAKSVLVGDSTKSNGERLRTLLPQDETDQLFVFCRIAVDAFFDNDLFWTTNTFLSNAKGSFGLCTSSTLDSDRQVCLAARGQTMSVAFYARKGIICYGSEAAAVKACLDVDLNSSDPLQRSLGDVDNDVVRLDLDDLGGEVLCLDWGTVNPVSKPHRGLQQHKLIYGAVTAILKSSTSSSHCNELYHRMTRLTRNELINPLKLDPKDPVRQDIEDIPRVLKGIQDGWHSAHATTSMNRLAAFTLSRCLRARLEDHVRNESKGSLDILVTGCEVSLWVGEQFASDLQKAFPKLSIAAISSNKLLGLYGQSLSVPCIGFPFAPKTADLHETIVIIVSQSGGTFSPLACSNLLQSATKNLFVVTSEWDTQVGKQLRGIDRDDTGDSLFNCRIFSTGTGLRAAEPCTLTVAATHQLLTQLFGYISALILSDDRFRRVSGAKVTEHDLSILERCNQDNIGALSDIVGTDAYGYSLKARNITSVEGELRKSGDLWSEHILENTRAYILSALYIFGTVVSGHALATALSTSFGLKSDWKYLFHFLDAAIYFWLPQINITLIRMFQRRNLLHRMVGRTVVIGDVPWVSQCAEALLSKLFACSYSIAGLNVLSGNPSDHLVHRHTHRVVRGTLLVCGRPDGRLSALSTAEASVCLSVNQACSIQSYGGTCESITIGHNDFQLPLSHKGIFLKRKRPLFLCERLLRETDVKNERSSIIGTGDQPSFSSRLRLILRPATLPIDLSASHHNDLSTRPRVRVQRSAAALLGAFMNLTESSSSGGDRLEEPTVDRVLEDAIRDGKWSSEARKIFQSFDNVSSRHCKVSCSHLLFAGR